MDVLRMGHVIIPLSELSLFQLMYIRLYDLSISQFYFGQTLTSVVSTHPLACWFNRMMLLFTHCVSKSIQTAPLIGEFGPSKSPSLLTQGFSHRHAAFIIVASLQKSVTSRKGRFGHCISVAVSTNFCPCSASFTCSVKDRLKISV